MTAAYEPGDLPPDRYLRGRWTVERRLRDAAVGAGRFAGVATFAPDEGGLAWRERGRLRLGRHDGPASRLLRVEPAPHGWLVRFSDGRLFHRLALRARCSVTHACGADLYEGTYEVLGPSAFDVRWHVRGPGTDQTIVSRYRRA